MTDHAAPPAPDPSAEPAAGPAAAPPPLPPPPAAAPATPFLTKEQEAAWASVQARLRAPRRWWSAALLLVVSLGLFLLVQLGDAGTPASLAVLVGVLLLHEGGHWLAMRLLGWQDVRMFFIPFFGAAVSGRRAGAASWKEGVVLLAGPLPGLLLGLALAAVLRADGDGTARSAASMLLAINGFNLLPLAALDGGKVLQLTLFQRHRALELAFLVLAALGMVAAAVALDARVLYYVAFFTLASLPFRHRLLKGAQALRHRRVAVPSDVLGLEGPAGREVFLEAWGALTQTGRSDAKLAGALEGLVDLVSRSIPSRRQTAALLGAWALGLAGGAAGLWLLRHPALTWREVRDPGGRYTLLLPGEPKVTETVQEVLEAKVTMRKVAYVSGDYGFLVIDLPLPPDAVLDLEGWWSQALGGMQEAVKGQVLWSRATTFQGRPGMAAQLRQGENVTRMAGFQHGGHRYYLVATAPLDDESVDRFFDSVALQEPQAEAR
jgi:Zn-dependent protease